MEPIVEPFVLDARPASGPAVAAESLAALVPPARVTVRKREASRR
jgi:hypothetical protein